MLRPVDIAVDTAPAAIITLTEAKSWSSVMHASDDTLIGLQVAAACELLDGPRGTLGRAIGGGKYRCRYEGVTAGAKLAFGLAARAGSDVGINQAVASAQPVKHEYGRAYLVADASWLTDGECELLITYTVDTDAKVKALALTIAAQMYAFREESITEQVRNNPVVRRLIEASKARLIA